MVVVVEHAHVQHEIVGLSIWMELEANAQPAVPLDGALKIDGRYRICKYEEVGVWALVAQTIVHELIFVVEHFVQPAFTYVPTTGLRPVDLVGIRLVVCRHGFGNRPGSRADLKKVARYLLSSPNFSERAVDGGIQVDFKCFLFCFE